MTNGEVYERVMRPDVTFEDWKDFKKEYIDDFVTQSDSTAQPFTAARKMELRVRMGIIKKVTAHVLEHLSEHEIARDNFLVYARYLISETGSL